METWEGLTMSRKEVVRPGLLKALVAGQLNEWASGRRAPAQCPASAAPQAPLPGGWGSEPGPPHPRAALAAPPGPGGAAARRGVAADAPCEPQRLPPDREAPGGGGPAPVPRVGPADPDGPRPPRQAAAAVAPPSSTPAARGSTRELGAPRRQSRPLVGGPRAEADPARRPRRCRHGSAGAALPPDRGPVRLHRRA